MVSIEPVDEQAGRRITHSLVKALQGVPDFASLSERTLVRMLGASSNLVWQKDSTVFEAGSPSDALYIVLNGEVRVIDAEEGEIARIGPGGYFGERSLYLGEMHSKRIEAAEPTELMVIPKEKFEALLESDPQLTRHFGRIFRDRVEAFERAGRRT